MQDGGAVLCSLSRIDRQPVKLHGRQGRSDLSAQLSQSQLKLPKPIATDSGHARPEFTLTLLISTLLTLLATLARDRDLHFLTVAVRASPP